MEEKGYFIGVTRGWVEPIALVLTQTPNDVKAKSSSPIEAAWRMWAVSRFLRLKGDRSRANVWFNAAMHMDVEESELVFWAELISEGAISLFRAGHVGESINLLDNAEYRWRELCDRMAEAYQSTSGIIAFALPLHRYLAAFTDSPLPPISKILDGSAAGWLVKLWKDEVLIPRRGDVAATFARGLAMAQHFDDGRRVVQQAYSWIENNAGRELTSQARVALYQILLASAEVELAAGEVQRSADIFEQAAELYSKDAFNVQDIQRYCMAKANQGNSLLRLERYEEALKLYAIAEEGFLFVHDDKAVQQVRHGIAYAQSKIDFTANLGADIRENIIASEENIQKSGNLGQDKVPLMPQYRLLLDELTGTQAPTIHEASEYLRLLNALRDSESLSGLARKSPDQPEQRLLNMLTDRARILGAYMERLADAMILFVESGANSLTFLVIRGGTGPLENRLVMARGSTALTDAVVRVIQQQRDDLKRIAEGASPAKLKKLSLERNSKNAWYAFPGSIRRAIEQSKTIFYSPSSEGNLDEFPIELLLTDTGWLGITHSITRLPTLRTLLETLSPNRMPSAWDARAYIVSAEAPPGFQPLKGARSEANVVIKQLKMMGLKPVSNDSPTEEQIKSAMDEGYRVFHYIGHGVAGELGEALPFGPDSRFLPQGLSLLSGAKTPFTYLSACQAGRARPAVGGAFAGLALRFLEKGSPAVIGSLQEIPDKVAAQMAQAFYDAAQTLPAGWALARARQTAAEQGFHPATWGGLALFGDPNFMVQKQAVQPQQTCALTLGWPGLLNRYMATRASEQRSAMLKAFDQDLEIPSSLSLEDLKKVRFWISNAFTPAPEKEYSLYLKICMDLVEKNFLAAASLRMLLALESFEGCYQLQDPDKGRFAELSRGLNCAYSLQDGIAWTAYTIKLIKDGFALFSLQQTLQMLDEAEGILEGWSIADPSYNPLFISVQDFLKILRSKILLDLV